MAKEPRNQEGHSEEGVVSDLYAGSRRLTLGSVGDVLHLPKEEVSRDFFALCNRLLAAVESERRDQGKRKMTMDEGIIFVNEMYRTYLEHKDHTRKTGEPYFDTHLVGATEIVIKLMGMVGLPTILATLKHDNEEDLLDKNKLNAARVRAEAEFAIKYPGENDPVFKARFLDQAEAREKKREERRLSEGLIDITNYREDLSENVTVERIEQLIENVRALVDGVTKFRKAKAEETAEATFKKLLEVALDFLRTIYVKLADRVHNVETISGHGDEEKQKSIMEETEIQYLSLARILRIRIVVQFLVEKCCQFFNPDLLKKFDDLAVKRRGNLCSNQRNEIRSVLSKGYRNRGKFCRIKNVQFLDLDLSNYVELVEKSFKDMTLGDLDIGPFDPMQEILVTVDVGNPENRLRVLNQVALTIQNEFASIDRAKFSSNIAPANDPDYALGMKIVCYNPNFGHLRFRINDSFSEARSKRGVLAESSSRSTPDDVRAMIGTILDKTLRNFHGKEGVKQVAKSELLRPRIEVLTPGGEIVRLPNDSTGLDFAAAVHSGLLVGMKGLSLLPGMTSMEAAKPVDPFASLVDGMVYIVESWPEGKSSVRPEWLLFANTVAAKVIRNHLSKAPDPGKDGFEYLNRISGIFNIGVEELVRIIRKKYIRKSLQDIYREVATGIINPVSIFSKHLESRNNRWVSSAKTQGSWDDLRNEGVDDNEIEAQIAEYLENVSKWEIEVQLPEMAGSLRAFSEEFSLDVGIKIDRIKSHTPGRDGETGTLTLVFDLDDNKIGIYDFFVKLMKLNFKYSARITNPIVEKLADLKI